MARPPSSETAALLRAAVEENCRRAAALVADADVLLLCTGAGFSADSGLAVYDQVAKIPAYEKQGLQYHDVCDPRWLQAKPALFWGFWGQCFNDYRNTAPHPGYEILDRWADSCFRRSAVAEELRGRLGGEQWPATGEGSPYPVNLRPGAFFAFTSNVDAHHFDWFRAEEIHECHGNVEVYQCADDERCARHVFRIPRDFAFLVEQTTMLAPTGAPAQVDAAQAQAAGIQGEVPRLGQVAGGGRPHCLRYMPPLQEDAAVALSFQQNHPKCPHCHGDARPAILMFGDFDWVPDIPQEERFNQWLKAVAGLAVERAWAVERAGAEHRLKVVILECGAGNRVPTVRNTSERTLLKLLTSGADAHLVRVNDALPLGDRKMLRPEGEKEDRLISIMDKGLAALTKMNAVMEPKVRGE